MPIAPLILFAQATVTAEKPAAPAVASKPWWQLLIENGLALTILFVFLVAIVSVVVNQRRKDKCLKLLHDFHITCLTSTGKVIWGDLLVYANALEILFDQPHQTRRGLFKTSHLIYDRELPEVFLLARTVDGLTDDEKPKRRRQIRRSFRPHPIRRSIRALRNLVNTLKDAFSKALSAIIGAALSTGRGAVLATQRSGVEKISETLLGAVGNCYEPMLEKHIGKPVVLQLTCPDSGGKKMVDFPGYLVDYTEKYLAVFNVEHEPIGEETLEVSGSTEGAGYEIAVEEDTAKITCVGSEALVVKSIGTRRRHADLDVVLTHNATLGLSMDGGDEITLRLQRTRRIDLICSRNQAIIYFGGEYSASGKTVDIKARPTGIAPEQTVETESDEPIEGDPKAGNLETIDEV